MWDLSWSLYREFVSLSSVRISALSVCLSASLIRIAALSFAYLGPQLVSLSGVRLFIFSATVIGSTFHSFCSFPVCLFVPASSFHHHHYHHHQFLNHEGRWGTTDDFATSFLHFPLFSTALWDLSNCRPVFSLMLSSHLFLCPPCLLPPSTVPCKMVLARPDERENDHTTAVCVSLRSSGGLRVVQLPAGSWHRLPRW